MRNTINAHDKLYPFSTEQFMSVDQILKNLKRPRTLIRAAQINLAKYDHASGIGFLFGGKPSDNSNQLIACLIDDESESNAQRLIGDQSYNIERHILLLTAILYELRLRNT